MKKQIVAQFSIIRASIKTIENGRSSKQLRMNQQLVKVWNNTFKFLMAQAQNEYDRAICRAYYGMLSDQTAKELSWEEMKFFTINIMKGEFLL